MGTDASQIIDHVRTIRKRPAMYVGGTDQFGCRQIVFELIANSIDQVLAGNATTVSVSVHGDIIEVLDDGPGLPPYKGCADSIDQWLVQFHDSATAQGHAPHVHLCYHGCGMFVVNALSDWLEVESVCNGVIRRLRFEKGVLVSKGQAEKTNLPSGCRHRFVIDNTVFCNNLPDLAEVRAILFQSVHLFPGLRVNYCDERFYAPNGLADYLFLKMHQPSYRFRSSPGCFSFNERVDDIEIVIAAGGNAHESPTRYRSWSNGVSTASHGDHKDGLEDALSDVGWIPEVAMIHVVFHNPCFAGPSRDKLVAPHVRETVRKALRPRIESFFDSKDD